MQYVGNPSAQCRYNVADAGVAVSHVLICSGGPGLPWSSVCTASPSAGVCGADITWVVYSLGLEVTRQLLGCSVGEQGTGGVGPYKALRWIAGVHGPHG
jgi:hypothetical protein